MTSLQRFANAVTHARNLFHADRSVRAWPVSYEAKQAAYIELLAALPQVKEIPDFWRYVQNMPVVKWMPIIEADVARIMRKRSLCHDCGAAEIMWPQRRCVRCNKARRLATYRKTKERARIRQRMRNCPDCNREPLNPRQRLCISCQKLNRRKRNQRYQKFLKDGSVRRVQPEFTREGTSTIAIFQPATQLTQNVECEAVLDGGLT
jgi:hypothetical protein